MTQPIVGDWICSQGHHNSGGYACPSCGGGPTGVPPSTTGNPLVLVAWIALIFSAPVYPFAGSAAFLGALAMGRIGVLLDINAILLFVLIAAATMGAFYGGYLVEKRVSTFGPYRVLRDVIRFAAGVLLILNLGSDNRETPVASAEIVGMIIVFPLVLFLLKRLDRWLELGDPRDDPNSEQYTGKETSEWLVALGEKLQIGKAMALGALAGVVGFALGGDASILTGLIVFVVITAAVVVFTGGFAVLGAVNEKLDGALFKIAIGVPVGATVGGIAMRLPDSRPSPEGILIGAVAAPLIWIVWGMLARRRAG